MVHEKIIQLSNNLRDAGINVSIRSTKRACEVVDILIENKATQNLKDALMSVYIKDHYDTEKFQEVYDELFTDEPLEQLKPRQQKGHHKTSNLTRQQKSTQTDAVKSEIKKPFSMKDLLEEKLSSAMRKQNNLKEKDIENEDLNELNKFDKRTLNVCRKLGMKIANKRIKRQKKSQKNRINIQKTIRKNLKYGGKLVELQKTELQKDKSKHIFLEDISGSCDWISTWFFSILYGCQKTFNKITVYEFDNKIINITDDLKTESYYKTYENIMRKRAQHGMIHNESNMKEAFNEFLKTAPLNHRTYVIILSDCRDWKGKMQDGKLESAEILRKIVNKSKGVIILNPEDKEKWTTKTSCVKEYEDVGAKVYEVKNLKNMAKIIEQL